MGMPDSVVGHAAPLTRRSWPAFRAGVWLAKIDCHGGVDRKERYG